MFLTNNTTDMKYYILFGPPGAGKGTQATAMVEKYNLHHISTGALLRKEIAAGTELGLQAKALIENGCLVPDEVVEGMIESEFKTVTGVDGFLLDGFPRTIPQAEALEEVLKKLGTKIDYAVNIDVPDEAIVSRMSGRRACVGCGATYHIVYNPPKTENVCDVCGQTLILRDDDKPETVKNRLAVYHEQTQPLIDYYKAEGVLREVDGTVDMNDVFKAIVQVLGA
jgi:adenylate kinase